MGTALTRRRFTVDEYYCMAEAGILREDERVELLEGDIFVMSPIGSRHAACVKGLLRWFVLRVGDRAIVGVQDPIRLSAHSEPEPDIVLLRPRHDLYASGHPGPADVLLLIEVADTTLAYDRGVKLPTYARSGIPEVWIVDLQGERVEVYRDPVGGRYRQAQVHARGAALTPGAFPDLTLPVDDILGATAQG